MLNPVEQARFNTYCGDAMVGFAGAMNAASFAMAEQMVSFWAAGFLPSRSETFSDTSVRRARAQRARERERQKRARTRQAQRAGSEIVSERSVPRGAGPSDAVADALVDVYMLPWRAAAEMARGVDPRRHTGFVGHPALTNPMLASVGPAAFMNAWLNMDWTRTPAAWPMAFGMMTSGLPKTVAWPMAEANLAMMDAFTTLGTAMQRAFPAFGPGKVPYSIAGIPSFIGFASMGARDRRGADPFAIYPPSLNMYFKA